MSHRHADDRLALKAAADAGRQLAQPGHPWDNTTSLGRPQIIVYGDLTTHTTIDAVEEPATHILGQMAARRATQLLAGRAVPSGSGCCRRDGRARCAGTRALVLVEVKDPCSPKDATSLRSHSLTALWGGRTSTPDHF